MGKILDIPPKSGKQDWHFILHRRMPVIIHGLQFAVAVIFPSFSCTQDGAWWCFYFTFALHPHSLASAPLAAANHVIFILTGDRPPLATPQMLLGRSWSCSCSVFCVALGLP